MLVGYIGLFLFFRAKGGYRPVSLETTSKPAKEKQEDLQTV